MASYRRNRVHFCRNYWVLRVQWTINSRLCCDSRWYCWRMRSWWVLTWLLRRHWVSRLSNGQILPNRSYVWFVRLHHQGWSLGTWRTFSLWPYWYWRWLWKSNWWLLSSIQTLPNWSSSPTCLRRWLHSSGWRSLRLLSMSWKPLLWQFR